MLTVEELIVKVRSYQPQADEDLLRRAYEMSDAAHKGQLRKSGEPYFVHPVSVATLIADLRLDAASVVVGLLHDVAEDTSVGLPEIEKAFGSEIAQLVDGVTKLSQISFTSKEDRQAENFRKMLVAMARDIRVLVIKLCDRLDNMRSMDAMKPEARERISRETMEIYAPLANRLGMARMKIELEDLAFKYLEPDAFQQVSERYTMTQAERDAYIAEVCTVLSARFAQQGFSANVTGRSKHLWSIWRKMKAQKCEFEQVYDLIAFRALVESVSDCYACLGVVHSQWVPVPGRFKDYIALPKPNNYQSLHTTVIGPGRERIEIQLRTHEMNRVADQGVAAHWQYKERQSGGIDPRDAQRFTWLRQLMEFQSELKDPKDFLDSVRVDLFQDEVYVFTPKGEVRVFPRGSTPIDFAYGIHSALGDRICGARVNGAMVPLRYKLRNGDTVEVMTSPNQHPSKDWLEFVVTSRARTRVRTFMRTEQRERSLKLGRDLLEKEMQHSGMSLPKLLRSTPDVRRVVEHYGHGSFDDVLIAIGYGKLVSRAVCEFLSPKEESQAPDSIRASRISQLVNRVTGRDNAIRLNGVDDVLVRFPRCCNPLPGDEIVGFITRGRGLTVHERNCSHALDSDPARRVEVTWDPQAKINRAVQIMVTTANRPGILATVGNTFHQQGINISEASCRAGDDGRAQNLFTFNCTDLEQLKNLTRKLQKIQGVISVVRQ